MSNLSIQDCDVIPSAKAVYSRRIADETIRPGDLVYVKANKRFGLYSANGAGRIHIFAGIAANKAHAGQPLDAVVKDLSGIALGGENDDGLFVIGGADAGSVAPYADKTTGWFVTTLGYFDANNKLILNPSAPAKTAIA